MYIHLARRLARCGNCRHCCHGLACFYLKEDNSDDNYYINGENGDNGDDNAYINGQSDAFTMKGKLDQVNCAKVKYSDYEYT